MGLILDGQWTDDEPEELKRNSKNIRFSGGFRNFIRKKNSNFKPENKRYLLYVNHTCPWSHLVIIARLLKNLESTVGIVYLDSVMGPRSWRFSEKTPDTEIKAHHLYELYVYSNKRYTGRVTIPVLWDMQSRTIVNNNSSDILDMFETEFNQFSEKSHYSFYSKNYQFEEKRLDRFISKRINDGIYQCLLSENDSEKKIAERNFKRALAKLNALLEDRNYLVDTVPTVPDWKLFVTLIRFDLVYSELFFEKTISLDAFNNIQAYLKRLFRLDQISSTINFYEMVKGYYRTLGKKEDKTKIINYIDKINEEN